MDEFALIARFFGPLARGAPGALGLTDDAALLEPTASRRLVAATDAVVAGIHFLADDPPGDIARKLMRVNLSDLAAMGADPRAVLLAAVFPRTTTEAWLAEFADGLARDVEAYGVPLIGGDTVASDGPLTLTLTALGEVPADRVLTRAGGRAGDDLYVSGTIGDGSLGLKALRGGLSGLGNPDREALVRRYRLPEPRLGLGRHLLGIATAAIDVSDGLMADLGHVCDCSGTGAEIAVESVPLSDAARAALAQAPDLLGSLLTGGDDYELLFAASPDRAGEVAAAAEAAGVPVARIGGLRHGAEIVVTDAERLGLDLGRRGYRHFD